MAIPKPLTKGNPMRNSLLAIAAGIQVTLDIGLITILAQYLTH